MKKVINVGEKEKSVAEKWCRRQWVLLRNKENGRYGMVDVYELRYQKMRARISEWVEIMTLLKKEINCRTLMIGLTIADPKDYSPGMIRDYIKNLKQRLGKNLYGFAWVAEVQDRGAIHYHLLVVVKKSSRVPTPDKSGMWKWGSSNIGVAKSPYYLCAYIGKKSQKDLKRYPKSCRTYAVSYRLPKGTISTYLDNIRDVAKFEKMNNIMAKKYDPQLNVWEYVGSAVNKDYAEKVLTPLRSQEKEKVV